MTNKTFAIGDIHGCYDEMMQMMTELINHGDLIPEKDIVVFLGDYIDRGPKSRQVIEQLIQWERAYPHWKFLYGNHEDLMLDALVFKGRIYGSFDLWFEQGGKETTRSYFGKGHSKYEMAIMQPKHHIKWTHLDWLRKRPRYFENKDYFFVHAGIPDSPLKEIKHLAKTEGESNDMLQAMIWAREPFISSKYDWGKKIIFGHTADYKGQYYNSKNFWGKNQKFMPIVKDNKIGLDCAVCPPSKERLCAIRLPDEHFFFVEVNKV